MKKLKAKNQLYGEKITINVAQKTISDILNNDQPPPLTVEKIIDEVAHGRDHSTIVYAISQIEKNMAKDPGLKITVNEIIKNIRDR